ncbi:MAG TPA: bacillithiol system redox-active protein YtxJ [Pyrinomonadaceae bacterium]|nr:bacillithiol system redox-active protein YtxJ [Pyrinomonadaceae bacterium]
MSANFINVDSIEGLERLVAESHERPVILFKHSLTCGISSGVYREVSQVNGDINLVVIQTHREISNAIATITGVRHESPQAIVLRDGEPVYHASHYDIEAEHIEAKL